MRTSVIRASRAAFAALISGVLVAGTAGAQGRGGAGAAPAQAPVDYNLVQIKTEKITNNFYTFKADGPGFYPAPNGRPFGTIGALVGPDGVFLVDGGFAQLNDKIIAAIRAVSDGRIRMMVNTHVHPDHTGNNENLGKLGVTILARENLRKRMATPAGNGTAAPAPALPTVTYDAPVTVFMNGEQIHLIPIVAAHTDGDTMVHFPAQDILMLGDFFRTDNNYPNIDVANGGSLAGFINGLNAAINLAGPNTKIIAGHGAISNKAGAIAHRDMMVSLRDKIAAMIREGKTQDDVLAAKLTAEYDAKATEPLQNANRILGQIYQELKK